MPNCERIKRIHSDLTRMYVQVEHVPSRTYGVVSIPIGDCPVRILSAIKDDDWTDPLLQEMEAECINILRDRAKAAQSILGGIAA